MFVKGYFSVNIRVLSEIVHEVFLTPTAVVEEEGRGGNKSLGVFTANVFSGGPERIP